MLADELSLLLEGARVTAQCTVRDGLGDRLIRMGEAMIAAHDRYRIATPMAAEFGLPQWSLGASMSPVSLIEPVACRHGICCNCQHSGVLSFGSARRTYFKFWEQSIIDDRSCLRGAATCPTLSVFISPAGLKCWCRNSSRLASQAPARRACATRPSV